MEITCEHVWREVSNYLDGDIDFTVRAAVEEHVRGCKHCAAVLDGTRNVLQLVGDERVLELPMGFEQRLQRRLGAEHSPLRPKKSYLNWMVLATAAALLIGVLAISGRSAFREPRVRSEMAHPAAGVPVALVVYVAENGKTFHVAGCRFLHDKAKVHSMPAGEALREGYSPCIHCMKEYLSTRLTKPGDDLADDETIEASKHSLAQK